MHWHARKHRERADHPHERHTRTPGESFLQTNERNIHPPLQRDWESVRRGSLHPKPSRNNWANGKSLRASARQRGGAGRGGGPLDRGVRCIPTLMGGHPFWIDTRAQVGSFPARLGEIKVHARYERDRVGHRPPRVRRRAAEDQENGLGHPPPEDTIEPPSSNGWQGHPLLHWGFSPAFPCGHADRGPSPRLREGEFASKKCAWRGGPSTLTRARRNSLLLCSRMAGSSSRHTGGGGGSHPLPDGASMTQTRTILPREHG